MLAGRPHEAAGNGSPRWMAEGPRERVHRIRQNLTPALPVITLMTSWAMMLQPIVVG
jgi:hypothetical protein